MHKVNIDRMEPVAVTVPGAEGVSIQWLVSEANGEAPNFALRRFIIEPGGNTPYHTHDWEHVVYTLAGTGVMQTEEGPVAIRAGDAMIVAPDAEHNFENTGDEPLELLCLVPNGPATQGH